MAFKQEKWRTSKRKTRDSSRSPTSVSMDSERTGCGHVNIELLNNELLNHRYLDNGDLLSVQEELTLPYTHDTPEIREALKACKSRLLKSGRDLDQTTLDAKIINLGSPEKFLKALRYTAGLTRSKNIYPEPEERPPNGHFKTSNHERNKEQILKSLEEAKRHDQRRNSQVVVDS
jgi:hypothetical protein